MADKSNDPANASGGGESPENSGGAPATPEYVGKIMERLEGLAKTQENQRSLHDRQMTEIINKMRASSARSEEDDGDDEGGERAAPAKGLTAGRLAEIRDSAITRFKVDNPDWQKYWKDIEEIGGDAARSKRFVRFAPDPDTGDLVPDFYASLADIKEHVEMQHLRKQIEDSKSENQQAQAQADQARSDAGAIGGSPASIPQELLGEDYKKLSYDDKVRKLAKLGLISIDPKDPPGALR